MAMAAEEKNSYYYVNGQRVPLVREPSVYAVKFARGEKSDSPTLSRQHSRLLREESENIYFVPNYGLQIYRIIPRVSRSEEEKKQNIKSFSRSVEELNKESAVEYAAPAFRRTADSPELMYATNRFVVQFKPDVRQQQIDDLNAQHGVTCLEELGYCENGYLLQAPAGSGEHSAVALANAYYESGLCLFANPDFVRKTHFRDATPRPRVYEVAHDLGITNESLMEILHDMHVDVKSHMSTVEEDIRAEVRKQLRQGGYAQGATSRAAVGVPTPATYAEREVAERTQYLSEQWHLTMAKVTDAWSRVTRGSSAIKICVMDDGIDVDHPEFSGKVTRQYDFAANVENARPKTADDNHGTACAGVATARGQKALGAAPDCSLIAMRTPSFLGVADEAQMFRRAAEWGADIISCSWGPTDGTRSADPLPDSTRAAINYCVTQGRGGKGIPIFWAAGNGNESVSLDGYAVNPDVIAVAASTSNETRAWYSDFGPEIWVCAPSSGDRSLGERRIFTVDRTGNAGYNTGDSTLGDVAGDYTNNFGGTSSATPLVAGIAGLMLSAAPNLTHRQVRDILKNTADRIGGSSSYNSSGHSNEYGYGRVNALAAAQRARDLSSGGSSTTPGTGVRPSIIGPSTHPRISGAPTFQISPGANSFYAVEVATSAELFDQIGHGSERSQSNFYGSWSDTALLNAASYILPTAVWDRLKTADRLYFRIFTSTSSSDWVNYQVSTPDSQVSSAPSIQITGASTGTTPSTGGPTITGPASLDRSAGAPTFQIGTGSNTHYAVEVATRADLFDQNGHGAERTTNNFYGSWSDTALMSSLTYRLPTAVWDRLKSTSRLYYRVFTSADASSWVNYAVSTPDSQAANAQSIQIAGVTTGTTPAAGGALSISGPLSHDRASGAPTFQVNTGRNRFYAVEVAMRADLFDQNGHGSERTSSNFYGSWSDTALMSASTYTLSSAAWNRFKNADRLYYRLYTSSSQTNWVDFEVSTPDSQAISAPSVQLTGVASRTVATKFGERTLSAASGPTILGPEAYERGALAPTFAVSPGANGYYAVEVATESHLLCSAHYAGQRNDNNFFASWQRGVTQANGDTTYTLPSDAWQRLRTSERLFYSVVTTADPNAWTNYECSTSDDNYDQVPWINLRGGAVAKLDLTPPDIELPRYTTDRSSDERLWWEQA